MKTVLLINPNTSTTTKAMMHRPLRAALPTSIARMVSKLGMTGRCTGTRIPQADPLAPRFEIPIISAVAAAGRAACRMLAA